MDIYEEEIVKYFMENFQELYQSNNPRLSPEMEEV